MTLFSSLEITSKQEWKTEKQTLSLMKPGKICNDKTKCIRNGHQLQLNSDRKPPKDMTADLRTPSSVQFFETDGMPWGENVSGAETKPGYMTGGLNFPGQVLHQEGRQASWISKHTQTCFQKTMGTAFHIVRTLKVSGLCYSSRSKTWKNSHVTLSPN